MIEGTYYSDLSPVAKIAADEFIERKFMENLTDRAISAADQMLRKAGVEPWAIMFDATRIDDIQLHVTGMFKTVPHQVAYPAAKLRTPKYVILSHNRACVAAITADPNTRLAAMTVNQYLQEHFDNLRKPIVAYIRSIMVLTIPKLRDPGLYALQRSQFIEDSAYEFSEDGKCLEEE